MNETPIVKIPGFIRYLCGIYFLGTALSARCEMPSNAHLSRNYEELLRSVIDSYAVIERIKESPTFLETAVPVRITCDGIKKELGVYINSESGQFVRDPKKRQGTFAKGKIAVLDPADLSKSKRVLNYDIQIRTVVLRRKGEDGKRFSPYLQAGGFGLCEIRDELAGETLTAFPKTYCVTQAWVGPLLSLRVDDIENVKGTQPKASAPGASRTLHALAGGRTEDILELIETGDFHCAAVGTMGLTIADKSWPRDLANSLDESTSEASILGAAYGLAAAFEEGMIGSRELKKVVEALDRNAGKVSERKEELERALEFLRGLQV